MDRSWTGLIHPDDRAATAKKWMHSLESGEAYSAEYRLRRTDGAFRFVKAQALPTYDDGGHVSGWLGMSKDITEERVRGQAREIDAKLAAVRQLASSISHEINNPLESVTNALFLVSQNHNIDEVTRSYLDMADSELRRLAHVTASSLRFHKQASAPVRKQLRQIVDAALSIYKTRLEAAGITVIRQYRDDAELFCYADDLCQAISNMIRNSIDEMKSGGRLFVRVRNTQSWTSEHRLGIRITVADTGYGIRREVGERLFEPFLTTKGATHAGLALWVTRQIVLKHGGKLSFRSSVNDTQHGTIFSMTLPDNGLDRDCND